MLAIVGLLRAESVWCIFYLVDVEMGSDTLVSTCSGYREDRRLCGYSAAGRDDGRFESRGYRRVSESDIAAVLTRYI